MRKNKKSIVKRCKKIPRYKSKEGLNFTKIMIFDLDEIIKSIPQEDLPKNKDDIERFLHTATDNIFYELKLYVTRDYKGLTDTWVSSNNLDTFSECVIDSSIYYYFILDGKSKKHYSINIALDEIQKFIHQQKLLTEYKKFKCTPDGTKSTLLF